MYDCPKRVMDSAASVNENRLWSETSRAIATWLIAVGLAGSATFAPDSLAQATTLSSTLPAMLRAASSDFQPVTTEQVSTARAEVSQRAEELDRWMVPGTRVSNAWKRYLGWDHLQQHLATGGQADLTQLASTFHRLNVDHPGLELPHFRRLSEALRRYIDVASAAALSSPREMYEAQLEALAAALEVYQSAPNPRLETAIGSRLDYLSSLGLSSQLVARVREQHARPNVFINLSSNFLVAAASEPIHRTGPVYDTILGTAIRGTSYTSGNVSVRPIPSPDKALLEFTSTGHIRSRNRGYNDPLVIRSTGYTDFTARKVVEFTDPVFRVLPSAARATTRTQIHSIRAQRGGPFNGIISRVGSRQVYQNKRRAEAIASDHAEYRIRANFDEDVLEAVRDFRRQYRDEFRYPLMRQGEYPDHVRFSSTSDSVGIELVQASRSQLGASGPPPTISSESGVVACLHQTAASNYTATAMGGATLSESQSTDGAQFDRPLPGWLKDAWERIDTDAAPQSGTTAEETTPGSEPARSWSITFRRGRPVSVAFVAGKVNLSVHTARLDSGSDSFENWDLVASYDLQPQDGVLLLTREGDIEMFPANFDPASGRRLSARQVAIRNNLNKVINELTEQGDGLPETVRIPVIELSGDLADVGPLELHTVRCENGWLTLDWNLP